LDDDCGSYSDLLYDFYFMLNFTSNTSSYVRIPVATFASNNDNNQCELSISYLPINSTGSENIILGS